MATNRLVQGISTPTVDFYLQADEISNDVDDNDHVVRCYIKAVNRGNSSTFYGFTNASVTASVNGNGFGVSGSSAQLASGTPNGGTFWTAGPFDITVDGNPDGTATANLTLVVSYPNASGTGGSKSGSFALQTLIALPGVPDDLSLVRNSDTQAALSWDNNGPSNGQPTSNQVRTSINGGAFAQVASVSATESLVLSTAPNRKTVAQVRETNSAGSAAWSASSNPIYTTPGAPTSVTATKDAELDITVAWTPTVAFSEHQHVVEFSTDAGDTWTELATVAVGTTSYKHVDPNAALVHVYRVRARNTATPNLTSAWVESNSVQLLAAPNKPTLSGLPSFADKAAELLVSWTHNPVDTTPQTAYEVEYSTNGGSSYTSTGKVTDTDSEWAVAANTYSADDELTVRVRTWGEATSGGSDGTGASPWSDADTVTFKTRPVVTIDGPADESTYDQADLVVELGFSQAESASFVSATIVLSEGVTVLETRESTTLAATLMSVDVADGGTYTLSVTVLDSHGITSSAVESTFDVEYTLPVAATVTASFDDASATAGLSVTIPEAGVGEVAAVAVSISRVIDGVRETLYSNFPISVGTTTFRDMTPASNGSNEYRVRTISADNATADTELTLETTDAKWVYLSTGPQFEHIVRFSRGLVTGAAPYRERVLRAMAGRARRVALFGPLQSLTVSGTATVLTAEMKAAMGDGGSTVDEIEEFLQTADRVCLRDPIRRIFGTVEGELVNRTGVSAELEYTVEEAS